MPEYRLIEQLGEGGMGVIWKALQLPDRREVAVKFLRDEVAQDRDLVKRFRVEVEACIKLSHPNIIKIHDAGVLDGRPYFAMELLHGAVPLDDYCRKHRPFPVARAAALMIQLLDALEYCHARGIIHRDLKPANVMVDEAEHLTLMDFGLVKDHGANVTAITAAGETVGSPRYMAPEVCRGGDADAGSDLWAAGCIFYEMLWGETPFLGDTLQQTVVAILRETPVPMVELRPEVGPGLDGVLARFLDKNPETRLSSARRARMLVRSWIQQWQDAGPAAPVPMPPSSPGVDDLPVSGDNEPALEADPPAQSSDGPRRSTRKIRALSSSLVNPAPAPAPAPPARPGWVVPTAAAVALVAAAVTSYMLLAPAAPAPPAASPLASASRPSPRAAGSPAPRPAENAPAFLASCLLQSLTTLAPRALSGRLAAEVRALRATRRADSDPALVALRRRWEQTLAAELARTNVSARAAALAPRLAEFYANPLDADGPDQRALLHAALEDLRELEDCAAASGVAMEEHGHALVSAVYAPRAAAIAVPLLLVIGLDGAAPAFAGELPGTAAIGTLGVEADDALAENLTTAARARTAAATAAVALLASGDPRDQPTGGAFYQHPRPLAWPPPRDPLPAGVSRPAELSMCFESTKLEMGVRVLVAPDRLGTPGRWIPLATLRPARLSRHVVTHALPPGLLGDDALHVRVELAWSRVLEAADAGAQRATVHWVAIAR